MVPEFTEGGGGFNCESSDVLILCSINFTVSLGRLEALPEGYGVSLTRPPSLPASRSSQDRCRGYLPPKTVPRDSLWLPMSFPASTPKPSWTCRCGAHSHMHPLAERASSGGWNDNIRCSASSSLSSDGPKVEMERNNKPFKQHSNQHRCYEQPWLPQINR